MIVQVKDIRPNPYRRIDKYPIDRAKVDALKSSISDTGFWDNILARDNNGIEIAYGHHRLQAIKELGITEVDIPVKNIDDATMIKIMANENMDDWKTDTSIIVETVSVAKDYLDGLLLNDWESLPNVRERVFESKEMFNQLKNNGVGTTIILRFLGSGWKKHHIETALSILNKEKQNLIDREAVESFKTEHHAKVFTEQMVQKKVPVEKQKEYVQQIIKDHEEKPTKDKDISSKDIRESIYKKHVEEKKKEHPELFKKSKTIQQLDAIDYWIDLNTLHDIVKDLRGKKCHIPEQYLDRVNEKLYIIERAISELRSE